MRLALPLFGYALAVAWWAPAPLARLTAPGLRPRLGLARIVGRALAGSPVAAVAGTGRCTAGAGQPAAGAARGPAAVVIEGAAPVAYCVAGRPATIVLSSGALEVLDPAQLGAVLAHERAHLAGRHHLLIALTRGLAAAFPSVPLFGRGLDQVTRLSEMCADDVAARRSGRPVLAGALLAMATGAAVLGGALGAMACAVSTRLGRLAEVPGRARDARNGLALSTLTPALAAGPALVTLAATRA